MFFFDVVLAGLAIVRVVLKKIKMLSQYIQLKTTGEKNGHIFGIFRRKQVHMGGKLIPSSGILRNLPNQPNS